MHEPGRAGTVSETTTRRWRGLAWFGLVLALGVSAAARAEVRLAIGTQPGSLPVFVAEARGYFADEGVTVRALPCAYGKVCLRMLLDGQAQLATVADLPIVLAAHAGERFAVVATINTNRNDTKIVTRRGSGIARAADLAGRTVGLHLGTTAQYALDSLLLLEGVAPDRVPLVDLQPGEGRTRLLAQTLDAVALFEPYAFEAAQALGAEAVVISTSRIYTQTWNIAVRTGPGAPTEFEIAAVLRALDRACAWIQAAPAEAQALLRQRTKVDAELVRASWPALDYKVTLDQSLLATFEAETRWALRRRLVQGAMPNYLEHIQAAPLRRVRPDRVTIAE